MSTWEQAFGQWMFNYAYEVHEEWTEHVDDDVDWAWNDIAVNSINFVSNSSSNDSAESSLKNSDFHDDDSQPPYAEAHGSVTGSVSVKTHRATRWNPAAYENHDIEIEVSVMFEPTEGGFDGRWSVEIDQLDSNPKEPPAESF